MQDTRHTSTSITYNSCMSWTSSEVRTVLATLRDRGGDSAMVEVKRASGGVPRLAETLCAFGNMPAGGTVVLGVDENDGFRVTGVADVAIMEAGVSAQARSAVVPPVQVGFDSVSVDGKDVVVVTVAGLPSAAKPCRAQGRAYLRQADGDYVMSEQEVAQLVALQDRPRYDTDLVVGSSAVDLDHDLAGRFVSEVRAASRRLAAKSDADVLRLRGVVNQGSLTIAGLYALGAYPQQYAPSLSLTAAAVLLGPGRRAADLVHLDGPLPDLLERAVEWVQRNTRRAVVFGPDGHGRDEPEIPLVAVRELVANALIHRDLSPRTQSKRVEVRLLPDRLVVSSPGGLWGVSREQLGEPGGKSAVNEFLYDIATMVRTSEGHRVIEGEGGGIREAREALRQAGLPAPEFIDTGVQLTVVVHRNLGPGLVRQRAADSSRTAGHAASAQSTSAVLLDALGSGSSSAADLAARTGLSRRQVKYALDRMTAAGAVVVDGGQGNRFTTYRLA